jgi:hypothetical protein
MPLNFHKMMLLLVLGNDLKFCWFLSYYTKFCLLHHDQFRIYGSGGRMYVIIGSHFCAAWRLVFTYSISYYKENIKCDNASNAPKCLQDNGVSIVQKLVVNLSRTSTKLNNVFATGGNNIVKVLGAFDALLHVMLSLYICNN